MKRKKLVVLSGAGISQESGIRTFREMGGLWEEYDVLEVATPQAWQKNPELVLNFYNERRKQLLECEPNEGHFGLAQLEANFDVHIITQNVDDLHERAGSSHVLHLHGELKKSRSTLDEQLIYAIDGWELNLGDTCEKGSQLRPHIVWFGEEVPAIDEALRITQTADIFVVVGTSLNVYPAAGLLNYVRKDVPVYLIDPEPVDLYSQVTIIKEKAGLGIKILKMELEKML
ncbi:MAG: NAD-dependent deacylase [Prolixibacteraceae bacterium]